ncbi:hypothetical protein [Streptomyces sp. Rer75]|uniref:hypothetical protein n=1 Tax=unclassified Streptomyces TaxID=2593676 RepID=UPI0035A11B6A
MGWAPPQHSDYQQGTGPQGCGGTGVGKAHQVDVRTGGRRERGATERDPGGRERDGQDDQ